MRFKSLCNLYANLWVFDCDGVIYNNVKETEKEVVRRMIDFIASKYHCNEKEAANIRHKLLKKYKVSHSIIALTLEGFDEKEILEKTYFSVDFDKLGIVFSPEMKNLLESLPGKKVILTNNHSEWARIVLEKIGISKYFSTIYGINDSSNIQKPNPRAFQMVQDTTGINENIVFIDDEIINIIAATQFGWTAVWKISKQG